MLSPAQYLDPAVARRVRRLDLRAKFIAQGFLAGLNSSTRRGLSTEFAEHRKYAAGDDPKTLDWTAWARTDRLFVRTFRAETNLDAYILVDTSLSMAYGGASDGIAGAPSNRYLAPGEYTGGRTAEHSDSPEVAAVPPPVCSRGANNDPGAMTKLEYATALAAAMGYLLTHQHDAVGLGLLGSQLNLLLRPRTARRQLVRILGQLARTQGAGPTGLAEGLHAVARRVRRRGLMVLLSDLVDEPGPVLASLGHLAARGHDIIVFQILDKMERELAVGGPVVLVDPETGRRVATDADVVRAAYTERVDAMVDGYHRGIRSLGGDFAAITTSTPFDQALCRFLRERKRGAVAR